MNHFAILLGGRLVRTDRLMQQLANARFIAADGGMAHAEVLEIEPEVWVGDFDSSSESLRDRYPQVRRETHPAEKNLTDGELAVSIAMASGATRLTFIGAMGGERTDHSLAHFTLALSLARQIDSVFLTSGDEEAYPLLGGEVSIPLPAGCLFSIIGLTDLDRLSIDNARYPLVDHMQAFGSSRTLSNVAEGEIAVRLGRGCAILLARPFDMTGV